MYEGNSIPSLEVSEIAAVKLLARVSRIAPGRYGAVELPQRLDLIAEWAKYHDVVPQILMNSRIAAESGIPGFSDWERRFRQACQFGSWLVLVERLNEEIHRLVAELTIRKLPFLVIKGQDLQDLYGEHSRFQRDIDLLCPDIETGWAIVATLSKMGYQTEKIKLGVQQVRHGKEGNTPQFYLLAPMVRSTKSGLRLSVDLHAGAFPVCGLVSLDCSPFFDRRRILEFPERQTSIPAPSREDSLLIMCAHACQHWLITFRDVNDFHVLTREHASLDWEYLLESVGQYGMTHILSEIASLAEDLYGHSIRPIKPEHRLSKKRAPHTSKLFSPREPLRVLRERFEYLISANSTLQGSKVLGFWRAVRDLYYLMRNNTPWFSPINNRPFRIYDDRKVQPLTGTRQIVLDRVAKVFGTKLRKAKKAGLIEGYCGDFSIRWLSQNCVVINEGLKSEFFITPAGIFAQCGYDGHLSGAERSGLLSSIARSSSLLADDIWRSIRVSLHDKV